MGGQAEQKAAQQVLDNFAGWLAENELVYAKDRREARTARRRLKEQLAKIEGSQKQKGTKRLLYAEQLGDDPDISGLGALLLKPRDLSPLEYREKVAAARVHIERYVRAEDPFKIPHRIWLESSDSIGTVNKVMEQFGLLAVANRREKEGDSQLRAQKNQLKFVRSYLEKLKAATRATWPTKIWGDQTDKRDSWSVSYEPDGRALVHCSYDHPSRLQTWTWDTSVMEELEISKDCVVDLMTNAPPFYQFVLEYGDATLARDKDASANAKYKPVLQSPLSPGVQNNAKHKQDVKGAERSQEEEDHDGKQNP